MARGVFIAAVTRLDSTIPALPGTELHRGDVLTLVGAQEDVARGAAKLGYVVRATQKTDFVFLGLGVLRGHRVRAARARGSAVSTCARHGRRLPAVGSAVRLDPLALSADRLAAVGGRADPQGLRPLHLHRGGGAVGGRRRDPADPRIRRRAAARGHRHHARAGALSLSSGAGFSSSKCRCCSARLPASSAARRRSARSSA